MGFSGLHVIITGGSSGIGKATGCLLARRGANLCIISRDPGRLAQARTEIERARVAADQPVLTIAADVSDRRQAEAAIAEAIARLGPPDILITSAGIPGPGRFLELPVETHERNMQVNYFGSLYVLRPVVAAMAELRSGHVVLVSSGGGLVGVYGFSAYSPAKFALRGLAEVLRGELKPLGIRVSIVYPPDTDTPLLAESDKRKPLETKKISATTKLWSADGVASEIVRGIERNAFSITPGFETTAIARLHSLFGGALQWYADRIVADVQSQATPDVLPHRSRARRSR